MILHDIFPEVYDDLAFDIEAYVRAMAMKLAQTLSVDDADSFVEEKLRDVAFVTRALQDFSRSEVMSILGDLDDDSRWSKQIADFEKFMLRNVDPKGFEGAADDRSLGVGLFLDGALVCLGEHQRTFKFIKAIFSRIEELEARGLSDIEVVDAGCGPIPVMAIMAALKSPAARVTCLEINKASLRMAEKIVERMGLSDKIDFVECDATEYEHPFDIDLLVSETMFTGLTNELIVQILDNLSQYMAEGGFIIPNEISVIAKIESSSSEYEMEPLSVYEYIPDEREGERRISFEIDLDDMPPGSYTLDLGSVVKLASGVQVEGDDSGISSFGTVGEFYVPEDGGTLKVSYLAGEYIKDIKISVN